MSEFITHSLGMQHLKHIAYATHAEKKLKKKKKKKKSSKIVSMSKGFQQAHANVKSCPLMLEFCGLVVLFWGPNNFYFSFSNFGPHFSLKKISKL